MRRGGDQWEAGIWSCDLRVNERPQNKLHEKGTEPHKTDIATLWENRRKGQFFEKVMQCIII